MARAVGIDLGTTNSVVSVLEGGEPTVIANAEGSRTTPSIVAFARNGEVLVGEVAKRQAVTNPDRTIRSVKREMGTNWTIDIDGKKYTPQEISARVLMKLKRDAEAYLGERITDAVITTPAYFNDAQRTATKEAGEIAGFNVLRIVNEPTAAAMAYGLDRGREEQTVLVFDLGGGGLSVGIYELGEGVVDMRTATGDNHLGGDDWDERIIDHLVRTFRGQHGVDLSQDKMAMQRLKDAAEKAKIELSAATTTSVNLPYITAGPLHLDVRISAADFELMTQDLVDRGKRPFKQAIKDTGYLQVTDLDHVILVGGSTRMPAVSNLVKQLSGKEPNKGVNPDEAVAVGAALYAGVLKGEVKDVLSLEVTPLSLGIETKGGVFTKLIERNTTIPTKRSEVFSTDEDNQPSYTVRIFEGEREMTADNHFLGTLELTGLPPAPRGVPQIEVTFDIDANGIVHVSAKDLGTGREESMTVSGGSALPKDVIDRMMRDAWEHAEADRRRREEVEARNLAEQLEWQTEKFLTESGDKLPVSSKAQISQALGDLRRALAGSDVEAITLAHERLTLASQRAATLLYAGSTEAVAAVHEAKILLLGEGTVGKTSLVAALRGDPFSHHDQTHGIEVHALTVAHPRHDADLTLRLWDFGGQALYRQTHQFFYTSDALYLVVWNARAGQKMNDVRGWLHSIRSRVGADASVMLVATHCEQHDPDLDYAALQQHYKGMLCGQYSVDNATGTGIAALRTAIAHQAATVGEGAEGLPRSWLTARDAILARAGEEPQIAFHEFAMVCARHGLNESDAEDLAKRMHTLGQIVYHDEDGLRDIVILDPEWLSKTIATVMEDRKTRDARGVLDHARLAEIWRHHRRLHPYFLRLMEKFDLSHRLDDGRHSLVAQLVPAARPALPWDRHTPPPDGVRGLRLITRLSEPVDGVVAALTVRLHESTTGLHWRHGVFLRHPNPGYASEALLELVGNDRLLLDVRAPAPDLFFHMIWGGIDAYFTRRWPGLRVTRYVPCPTRGCPGELPLDGLLDQRHAAPESSIQCLSCFRRHDLGELLTGVSPTVRAHGPKDLADLHDQLRRLQGSIDRLDERAAAAQAENAHALRTVLAFLTTEIDDCPPLFTLTRHQPGGLAKAKVHQDQYRLTLWCQQPDQWHPWPSSSQLISVPKAWVVKLNQYAHPIYRFLRAAVPVAGAVAGLVLDQNTQNANHELEQVKVLLAELPVEPMADESPSVTGTQPKVAAGANLREVREFIIGHCGPRFGGLERVPAPTGEYLWICPDHYASYDPGLPVIG